MSKIKVGSTVIVKANGRKGTVIVNDRSSMPYRVRMNDTHSLVWFCERDVALFENMTLCLSTDPISPKGALMGGIYIVENVQNLQAIPRKGTMTGFSALSDVKATLSDFSSSQFFTTNVECLSEEYAYVYRLVDGELVLVTDAKFETLTPALPPFERLTTTMYYKLRDDIAGTDVKAGTIVKLRRQEPQDYTGNLVYLVQKANSDEEFWVPRTNKLIAL